MRWNCEENALAFSISRQPPCFKVMVHPPNVRQVVPPYSQAKGAHAASFLLHRSQDEASGQVKTHSCYSVHSSNLKWDILISSHQWCCCRSQRKPTLWICNKDILVQCKKWGLNQMQTSQSATLNMVYVHAEQHVNIQPKPHICNRTKASNKLFFKLWK